MIVKILKEVTLITCIADDTWDLSEVDLNVNGSFVFPREAVKIYNLHQVPANSLNLFSAILNLVNYRFPEIEFEVCCSALSIKAHLYSGTDIPVIFQNYSLENNILKFTNNYNLTKPAKSQRFKFDKIKRHENSGYISK